MKITIAARYRPFSHTAGASCLLPKSGYVVQAFPALLRLYSLVGDQDPIEIPLKCTGLVREFTLQQDLEAGCVWIWGQSSEGRFRLRLEVKDGALHIEGMGGDLCYPLQGPFQEAPSHLERLSFGSHKAQDWDCVAKRADAKEMLPVLYALSQWTPLMRSDRSAMFDLLQQLDEPFLRAAFFHILCPRLVDDQHQGIVPKESISPNASPLALIKEAGSAIRKRFVEQTGRQVTLFAPQNASGRMTAVHLHGIGFFDFEWKKGRILRAVLSATESTSISLQLPKDTHSFRMRTAQHERGLRMSAENEWNVQKGAIYFLDRFEK